jgi:Flp pilus assembly pilin Flp
MRKIVNRTTGLCLAWKNKKLGQGYTEYVILLALIALVAYVAVQAIGNNISTAMNSTGSSV